MVLLGALLGFAVLAGPLARLRRTSPLPPGWHPVLVLSSWTVVVLLSGIAGDLRVGVWVVVAVGLALLVREVLVDRASVVAMLRSPTSLALAGTALALALLLHGRVFTHYDNFSHWALVLEVMLADHSLPTPADTVVTFTTYPLGGASLAFLFSTLLGRGEWVAMAGQSLFVASCALPLLSAAGRRPVVGAALYAVGAVVLVTHVNLPTNLLVDALVGGLGGALLVLVLLHREALLRSPWALGVLGAALVTVKSSGVFFVAVATLLALALLWSGRQQVRGVVGWLGWASALAAPWLVWWAWGRHVSTTFPAPEESKHSVSVERFETVLGEKTAEDVRHILGDLLVALVSDLTLWALLVGVLLAGALAVRAGALSVGSHRRLLAVAVATALLWEVSLALMYLYSMPLGEALVLAGFRRYQGTLHLVVALLALSALALWAGVVTRAAVDRVRVTTATAAAVLLTMVPLLGRADEVVAGDPTARLQVEGALAGVSVAPDDDVCVLVEEPDGGYRTWLTRYALLHLRVRSDALPATTATLPDRLDRCELFLLLDPRPHTAELLRAEGLALPVGQDVPVVVSR